MNHPVATDELKEQAALYALGALSQIEARQFEYHLGEDCQACKAELGPFEEVVGALGFGALPADPPPALRGRLLEAIKADSAQPARKLAGPARVRTIPEPAADRKPARGVATWLPWAIAACLAVFSIASIVAWRRTSDQITTLRTEADGLQGQITHEHDAVEELTQINGVLRAPGSVTFNLIGQRDHVSSTGQVYWDKQHNRWVVSTDLAPAPAGKQYQLWFLAPTPVSAGMIKSEASGHGFTVVQIPPGIGDIGAAAITLEPEGGSQKPTMPIYALGKTS